MGDREMSAELSMERVEKESVVALQGRVFTVVRSLSIGKEPLCEGNG